MNSLDPLTKVWVDYEPLPKNTFIFRINGYDIYSLVKEEVDYDPTQTETLNVKFKINDQKKFAIKGNIPWIIDEVEDKIQTALGMQQLTSLHIWDLHCKSWVANEFLDMLCSYDIPEQGLDKILLSSFREYRGTFEAEVVTRLANICPCLSYLVLNWMCGMSEEGRI